MARALVLGLLKGDAGPHELGVEAATDPIAAGKTTLRLRIQLGPVPELLRAVGDGRLRVSVAIAHGKDAPFANHSRRRGSGDTAPDKPDWMQNFLASLRGHSSKSPRASDAVAAAGFSLGASPRRRALVLILGDQADESRFTPDAIRAYLKEIAVPLVVLRVDAPRPAWPEAVPVKNVAELARAFSDVRTLLMGQAVVWAPPETSLADLSAP